MADSDLPPGCRELPNGEIVLPPFFILDEHSFTDGQDGELVHLDPERLQRIASNANRRRARTGDETPIILGHTDDNLPEKHQPEIVGRAVNWEVVPFVNGKQAIRVIPIAKDRQAMETFRKFPRRSVEYWKNTDEVDPIALLGATTPKRDLGYHKFSRNGRPYLYSCGVPTKMDMNPNDPQGGGNSALVAEIMESAPMKELMATCGLMKQFIESQGGGINQDPSAMGGDVLGGTGEPGMGGGDAIPGLDMDGIGDEPTPPPSRGEPDGDEEEDEEEKPRKTEMAAKYKRQQEEIAVAYRKGQIDWEKYLHLANALETVKGQRVSRMSRRQTEPDEETQAVQRISKAKKDAVERTYATKFQAQEARIQELEKKNLLQEVEATLTRLAEVDLIDFDPEEEKNALMKMSKKADRDAHVEKMRKRYQRRAPGNPMLLEGSEIRPERMSRLTVDPNGPQNPGEGISSAILQAEARNKGGSMSADEAIKKVRQANNGNANGATVKTR